MRIAVVAEGRRDDPRNFVGPIRLFDPLDAAARSHPLEWRAIGPREPFDDVDAVILQRTPFASAAEIEQFAERIVASGKPLVWELDDHLFCNDFRALIETSAIDRVDEDAFALGEAHRRLLPLASQFVCATAPLADAMRASAPGDAVAVIPVAVDFDRPRWKIDHRRRRRSDSITMGWSGGSRVGRDLEIVAGAVARLLDRHTTWRFVIAGAIHYAPLFATVPRMETIPWVPYDSYPRLIARFDAVMAPLDDHEYNRCKSALKAIDHAAAGVPVVCSRTRPYLDLPCCVRATAATEEEWIAAVEEAVAATPADRAALSEHARSAHHVRTIADRWWNVLDGIQ